MNIQIDITQPIMGYDGQVRKIKDESNIRDLTLRDVIIYALHNIALDLDGRPAEILTANDKYIIHALSTRLYGQKSVTFSDEEVVFIRKRGEKVLPSLWLGRLNEAFDHLTKVK